MLKAKPQALGRVLEKFLSSKLSRIPEGPHAQQQQPSLHVLHALSAVEAHQHMAGTAV